MSKSMKTMRVQESGENKSGYPVALHAASGFFRGTDYGT
jgi:hypothetical protein